MSLRLDNRKQCVCCNVPITDSQIFFIWKKVYSMVQWTQSTPFRPLVQKSAQSGVLSHSSVVYNDPMLPQCPWLCSCTKVTQSQDVNTLVPINIGRCQPLTDNFSGRTLNPDVT